MLHKNRKSPGFRASRSIRTGCKTKTTIYVFSPYSLLHVTYTDLLITYLLNRPISSGFLEYPSCIKPQETRLKCLKC